jgi:hypothetical protein
MTISQSRLQQLNDMMDAWLEQRKLDELAGVDDDDEDETDPVQFQDPHEEPVAEPPTMPQEDSVPRRPIKDLFA